MAVFDLAKFTNDPAILKYKGDLTTLYEMLLTGKGTAIELMDMLKQKIMEDETWLLNFIKEKRFKNADILNGLFLKIYDANLATRNWPPLSYPSPLLVNVPGYHGESVVEWCMRILAKIGRDNEDKKYRPTYNGPPNRVDITSYPAIHPFEQHWLTDASIRSGYDLIKAVQPNGLGALVNASREVDDERILLEYSNVGTIYEDTVCAHMNNVSRFYGPIKKSTNFEEYYDSLEKKATEFESSFTTNLLTSARLTRTGLPWAQQLFVLLGPKESPDTHSVRLVSPNANMGIDTLNTKDTAWIQFNTEPATYSDTMLTVIQGAFMPSLREFLDVYFSGVKAISQRVMDMLRDASIESQEDLIQRTNVVIVKNPQSTPNAINRLMNTIPFTPFGEKSRLSKVDTHKSGETEYGPLKSNLRRLRRTFRKPSWRFWGAKPNALIRNIYDKYGHDALIRDKDIEAAAAALQGHHTNENKEALIDALENAIRQRQRQFKSETIYGGTNYEGITSQLDEILLELNRAFFKKSWGKADRLIKQLLSTHLEEFIEKGDEYLVTSLTALRDNRKASHRTRLVGIVKEALEMRYAKRLLTAQGLPVPGVNSEGESIQIVPFGTAVTAARNNPPKAELKKKTNLRNLQKTRKSRGSIRGPIRATPIVRNITVPIPSQSTLLKRNPSFTDIESDGEQTGGWAPSLMTAFAQNGMRLLPIAGYMGYKMMKNSKTWNNKKGKNRRGATRKRRG